MEKVKKLDNIILRTDDHTHNLIRLKSTLFNRKKSDYLRHCALSYWEDNGSTKHFKELLQQYQASDDAGKHQVVDLLFEYYRRTGFPHNRLTDEQKINRMGRIIKTKDILLEDNHLPQNIQGLDLANSFHPHMMKVKYGGPRKDKSPYETFENDDSLKDCINRWMELGNTPGPAGMRRILKTRDGTRGIVNYKPIIAKFIYEKYVPENGRVLDPCAGYSGRLLGCIAANKNILYHGIDPDERTGRGNMECASFFSNRYDMFDEREYKFRFRYDLGCAEDVMRGLEGEYDVVATSPPYHKVEVYSEDPNQSCNRYPEYKKWLSDFLFVIIDESKRLLKESGKLILNVKNGVKDRIADDLCEYCKKDWDLETVYHMRLANSEFHRVEGKAMFHTEPIFVFSRKIKK